MRIVAMIALLAGVIGAALTFMGTIEILPLMYWGAIAGVGGVAVVLTRRPGD